MPFEFVEFQDSQKKPSVRWDSSLANAPSTGLPFSSTTRRSRRPTPFGCEGARPMLGVSSLFVVELFCWLCPRAMLKEAATINAVMNNLRISLLFLLNLSFNEALLRGPVQTYF